MRFCAISPLAVSGSAGTEPEHHSPGICIWRQSYLHTAIFLFRVPDIFLMHHQAQVPVGVFTGVRRNESLCSVFGYFANLFSLSVSGYTPGTTSCLLLHPFYENFLPYRSINHCIGSVLVACCNNLYAPAPGTEDVIYPEQWLNYPGYV